MGKEIMEDILPQLSMQELCELKARIDREIQSRLLTLGVNGELTEEEAACVKNRDLVRCVKLIRDRTGLGLYESRLYMDRWRAELSKREAAQIAVVTPPWKR